MVACLDDGRFLQRAGAIGAPVSSTDSEIIALREGLDALDGSTSICVYTDCKALADAINGDGELTVPLWGEVCHEIERRGLLLDARWVRKRTSSHLRAAHHLANAARVLGAIGGGDFFLLSGGPSALAE